MAGPPPPAPPPSTRPPRQHQIERSPSCCRLDGMALEEVDQLDDQDYYHHELEDKGSGLVELLDHEAVEIFGGVEFFLDQVFVVGDSDFLGAEFVETRGEHIAEELDGVVGVLGEFVDVEQDGVEFRGGRVRCAIGTRGRCLLFRGSRRRFPVRGGEEFVVVSDS